MKQFFKNIPKIHAIIPFSRHFTLEFMTIYDHCILFFSESVLYVQEVVDTQYIVSFPLGHLRICKYIPNFFTVPAIVHFL